MPFFHNLLHWSTKLSRRVMCDLTLQVHNNWRHRLTKAQGYTSHDIDYQQIKKCIHIGLLCVKIDRVKRPTINQIIKMLERSDEAYQNEREVKSPPNYSFIGPKTNQHLELFAKPPQIFSFSFYRYRKS